MVVDGGAEQPLMLQILDRMLQKLEGCAELDGDVLRRVAALCQEGALSDPERVVESLRPSTKERR
jgi:hypothetical protein